MLESTSPLAVHRHLIATDALALERIVAGVLSNANASASHNTYLHFDPITLAGDARLLARSLARLSLFGVPISLKDCFDLAGTVTTCGSRFYADTVPPALSDSAMATTLRSAGALITGKTHLHPLAYGITGQNAEYGDCLQPRDSALLTGGSSSGAAASVQEGSALAAIGTDTGGSIRVPSVLCGLTGYRTSHGVPYGEGSWRTSSETLWEGAIHLAPTFDTPGIILRDPRDLAPIAETLFSVPACLQPTVPRIGLVHDAFVEDATPEVKAAYAAWPALLIPLAASLDVFDPVDWDESREIFAAIQASEAAVIHRGNFKHFDPSLCDRLERGARYTTFEVEGFRRRLQIFRSKMADLCKRFDIIVLPVAPVHELRAADDQSDTRSRILRYTTPFSLAGCPVLSLPGELIGHTPGTGIQLAAAPGHDSSLLAFAAQIAFSLLSRGYTKSR